MEHLSLITSSIELFLLVTYIGVGIYLLYLFNIWKESSIGSWAIGTLFAGISLGIHLLSIYNLENSNSNAILLFKLATIFSFICFWWFGIAHLISRKQTADIILMVLLSMPLGFIIPYIIEDLSVISQTGLLVEQFSDSFNTYDLLNFLFFGLLYIIFARDSHLIYEASIKQQADSRRKSIAIGHLIAWQFFAIGTASLRYFAKYLGAPVYFLLPFTILLVPLLTLGSRPFDWVREGHEPVMIVLIDKYGTPTYSWAKKSVSIPLYLEGSTLATITTMLEDFLNDQLNTMIVNFKNYTLYTQTNLGYLSLLVTTGPHKSFEQLLEKIHQILVTDVIKQENEGIPGYSIPFELQWLLSQLLPDSEDLEGINSLSGILQKSGVNLDSQ